MTILTLTSPVRNLTFLQVGDTRSTASAKVAEVDVFDVDPAAPSPTAVPEPATLTLVAASLAGAGIVTWRRSRRRQEGSAAS